MLLDELRELVREVEAWARRERDPDAQAAAQLLAEHAIVARVTLVHWDDVEGWDIPERLRRSADTGSGSLTRRAVCASARTACCSRRAR